MLRPDVVEVLAGTTLTATLVNSGAFASPISSAILTASETLIDSKAATDSGGGFYYANHLMPTSGPQWLINEWRSYFSPNSYVNRQFIRVRTMGI